MPVTLPALSAVELLQEAAEKQLADQVATLQQVVAPLFAQRKYREGLEQLASLRAAVDAFFDNVMVMCDDVSGAQQSAGAAVTTAQFVFGSGGYFAAGAKK